MTTTPTPTTLRWHAVALCVGLAASLVACDRGVPTPRPVVEAPAQERPAPVAPAAPAMTVAPAAPAAPAASIAQLAESPAGAAPLAGGACSADVIAGTRVETGGETLSMDRSQPALYQGWAVVSVDDGVSGDGAALVLTSKDGKRFTAPVRRMERPDVASHFARPDLLRTGFEAQVSATRLAPGGYGVSVLIDFDGRQVECDLRRTVVLR